MQLVCTDLIHGFCRVESLVGLVLCMRAVQMRAREIGAGWEWDILRECMCVSDVTGCRDGLHNNFEMMRMTDMDGHQNDFRWLGFRMSLRCVGVCVRARVERVHGCAYKNCQCYLYDCNITPMFVPKWNSNTHVPSSKLAKNKFSLLLYLLNMFCTV